MDIGKNSNDSKVFLLESFLFRLIGPGSIRDDSASKLIERVWRKTAPDFRCAVESCQVVKKYSVGLVHHR